MRQSGIPISLKISHSLLSSFYKARLAEIDHWLNA